ELSPPKLRGARFDLIEIGRSVFVNRMRGGLAKSSRAVLWANIPPRAVRLRILLSALVAVAVASFFVILNLSDLPPAWPRITVAFQGYTNGANGEKCAAFAVTNN